MNHGARLDAATRHFPQLLDANRKLLRLTIAPKLKATQQLLGQIAAHTITEGGDLGANVDTRFERRLWRAMFVETAVAGAHAHHPFAVREHLLTGKPSEHVDPFGFHLRGQPANERVERNDEVAVVSQGRWNDRERQAAFLGEKVD